MVRRGPETEPRNRLGLVEVGGFCKFTWIRAYSRSQFSPGLKNLLQNWPSLGSDERQEGQLTKHIWSDRGGGHRWTGLNDWEVSSNHCGARRES
jgi:hypothetical protein